MEDGDKDIEGVTLEPRLDDLSMAIVDLMEDRRLEPTHERLYKKGATKLRDITVKEQAKQAEESRIENRKISLFDSYDPDRTFHRGKPAREALYDLHTDILRKKHDAEEQKRLEEEHLASQVPKLKESEFLRIEGFKKEFRTKLSETYGQEMNVKTTNLELNAVNSIVY